VRDFKHRNKELIMLKKLVISGLTAATLALGMGAASAPANAQVFFGFGVGHPGGWCSWHYCGPGYGYGWHHHHYDCWWTNVRRHHHWVRVKRCGWI
jgi:hypothetical protein